MTSGVTSITRFRVTERARCYGIMTTGALLSIISGSWLWLGSGFGSGTRWRSAKLLPARLLTDYPVYGGMLVRHFRRAQDTKPQVWRRRFSEAPVVMLRGVVIFVAVQPF
jgi:uncharacterized membrane protein